MWLPVTEAASPLWLHGQEHINPNPITKKQQQKNEGLCSLKEWCLCGRGDSVFKNVKVTLVEAGGYGPPESIAGGRIWGIFLSLLNFLAN